MADNEKNTRVETHRMRNPSTLQLSFHLMLAVVLLSGGCGKQAEVFRSVPPEALSGKRAFEEVRQFVELGPRDSGTDGAAEAAHYIEERLKQVGLEASLDVFAEPTPKGSFTFRNVIGRIPGTSETCIVLVSHYDTKSGISDTFTGANDSGSSTGLLLALAETIRTAGWNGPELIFGFVDGEECIVSYSGSDGLHGSRRLAKQLLREHDRKNVLAVIVLDMIGDRDLSVTLPRNGTPALLRMVFDAARETGVRSKFTLNDGNMLDDHVPFLLAGFPAVDMIDFEYGSKQGRNDYWHTPEDTLDKLSPESLESVGRVTLWILNALAGK